MELDALEAAEAAEARQLLGTVADPAAARVPLPPLFSPWISREAWRWEAGRAAEVAEAEAGARAALGDRLAAVGAQEAELRQAKVPSLVPVPSGSQRWVLEARLKEEAGWLGKERGRLRSQLSDALVGVPFLPAPFAPQAPSRVQAAAADCRALADVAQASLAKATLRLRSVLDVANFCEAILAFFTRAGKAGSWFPLLSQSKFQKSYSERLLIRAPDKLQ